MAWVSDDPVIREVQWWGLKDKARTYRLRNATVVAAQGDDGEYYLPAEDRWVPRHEFLRDYEGASDGE